jgi:hypothetical protein
MVITAHDLNAPRSRRSQLLAPTQALSSATRTRTQGCSRVSVPVRRSLNVVHRASATDQIRQSREDIDEVEVWKDDIPDTGSDGRGFTLF